MRFNFTRESFIPKDAEIIKSEKCDAICYLGRVIRDGIEKGFSIVCFGGARQKPDQNYLYKHEANARDCAAKYIAGQEFYAEAMALRKEGRKFDAHPFVVGSIIHYSWGYDQTNCDLYQVIESKPKSVVLRAIAAESVPGSGGFMSENIKPVKDKFLEGKHGEPFLKIVKCSTDTNGQKFFHIRFEFGIGTLVSEDSKHYSSWYA